MDVKVYLIGRYSRREELLGYAEQLKARGFRVTSRWLEGHHELGPDGRSRGAPVGIRGEFAREDLDDLRAADWAIAFTEPPEPHPGRGGRHVEFGAALAWGKLCFVVGPLENVFCCLAGVNHCETWGQFVDRFLPGRRDS
jgi:hypothetical protein